MGAQTYLHHTSNAYHKDFHHTYPCDNAKVIDGYDTIPIVLCRIDVSSPKLSYYVIQRSPQQIMTKRMLN
jgi:hypothetical protein